MLTNETDPTRREHLGTLRERAVLWWSITAGAGVIVLIFVLIAFAHSGAKRGNRVFDADIKTLAAAINRAPAPEITDMPGFLLAWGQPVPSSNTTPRLNSPGR